MKKRANKAHYRYLVPLAFMLILLHSCEKERNVEYTDTPVIEGYLMPDKPILIEISRQYPFLSDVAYSNDHIDSLEVYLSFDNQKRLLHPYGKGVYGDSNLYPEVGKYYTLEFRFNDKDVSAFTYLPEKPRDLQQSVTSIEVARRDSTSGFPGSFTQPEPIEITWENNDRSYYLVLVENLESVLDPIIDFGDQDPPGSIFRKTPSITSSESLRSMEFQYFGTHAIIVCHVLPDYASMYGENTASSLNLTSPSSSIVNGYGIFTGLNMDTLYIEVNEQ